MCAVRISAALIAKDEADKIGACLASLAGQVDEIVVVDTGSRDATMAIARSIGARTFAEPWTGDFSAARNAALRYATGSWILYIDADERLAVASGRLHDAIDPKAHAGVMVRLHPRLRHTAYQELRLFKHDPRIVFTGRMHEQIIPAVRAVCASDGKTIGNSAVTLHHVGYEGDLTRKHHRNLPLLERAVQEQPDRLYCWCHLGETLAGLGRLDAAEQALRRGIAIVSTHDTEQNRVEASLCYQRLAKLYIERGEDPRVVIAEGLRNHPGDHCLRLLAAKAEIELGDPVATLPELDALAAVDATTFYDPLMAYDKRTFSLWPHALAGVANFRLGRFAEAHAAFHRAARAEHATTDERQENAVKAQLAAARAGLLTAPAQ
jgi:tetratricopeptide (TPR) repeat protein